MKRHVASGRRVPSRREPRRASAWSGRPCPRWRRIARWGRTFPPTTGPCGP